MDLRIPLILIFLVMALIVWGYYKYRIYRVEQQYQSRQQGQSVSVKERKNNMIHQQNPVSQPIPTENGKEVESPVLLSTPLRDLKPKTGGLFSWFTRNKQATTGDLTHKPANSESGANATINHLGTRQEPGWNVPPDANTRANVLSTPSGDNLIISKVARPPLLFVVEEGSTAALSPSSVMKPLGTSTMLAVFGAPMDERIDYIAELQFRKALSGGQLLLGLKRWKGQRIIGLDGWQQFDKRWEPVYPQFDYQMARIGIQLSDRRGALRADELIAFQDWVTQQSKVWSATIQWSTVPSPLERASELYEFCRLQDVTLNISVVFEQLIDEQSIADCLQPYHYIHESPCVYVLRSAEGQRLCYAIAHSNPSVVTFSLEMPQVPQPQQVFDHLMRGAYALAGTLSGRLLYQNTPLDNEGVTAITNQFGSIEKYLEEASIPCGSPLALRLFS